MWIIYEKNREKKENIFVIEWQTKSCKRLLVGLINNIYVLRKFPKNNIKSVINGAASRVLKSVFAKCGVAPVSRQSLSRALHAILLYYLMPKCDGEHEFYFEKPNITTRQKTVRIWDLRQAPRRQYRLGRHDSTESNRSLSWFRSACDDACMAFISAVQIKRCKCINLAIHLRLS